MGRIAAADLLPNFSGHSLDHGRYRVLENIGSGAYGKVYLAVDASRRSSNPQFLAIKCLKKPQRGSRSYLLQRREFEHHKLVSGHPNIVAFHRCFSDGLFVYVVLDFCNGGDLFSAITEKRLFYGNDRLIKSVFVQLLEAVGHCHKVGVFHRDIKPENVLCSDDGIIRLSDFGLSIMSPYSIDFGCGSIYYMSPECLGRQVHRREYATSPNDIWALGVILTNIITGRNPWTYATTGDECFAAYIQDNDFLKNALPISEGVNNILKGIFVLNPARRLTLAELRNKILALDTFSTDLAVEMEVPCGHSAKVAAEPEPGLQTSSVPALNAGNLERQSNVFIGGTAGDVPIHVDGPSDPRLAFSDGFDSAGSLSVPFSDSSGSSGPESKGPITPTTRAIDVDPPIDIPDISSAFLGDSVGLQKSSIDYPRQEAVSIAKARRPADILRAVVRRVKILSRSNPVP